MPDWKDEVARLDIADVARRLGLQVTPGNRSPRLAVCPFHEDTEPSLHLYQDADPHYHCFACHAHGDTVELVKQKQNLDFGEALTWLGTHFGLDLGRRGPRGAAAGKDIRQRALQFLRERDDTRMLGVFAETRGLPRKTLSEAGLTAGALSAFLQTLTRDRAAQDDAVAAGLAYAPDADIPSALRSRSLSPFVRGDAIFIPLANLRGKLTGVMARPLTGGGPRYRFTSGLKKSEILYRGDHVRRLLDAKDVTAALDEAADRFDLFVVEGVMDALRLETLGLPAVAILGSAMSDSQVGQIAEIAELALEKGRVLRVHVFLDADNGGRDGLADALPRLLRRATEAEFLVDAVAVDRPQADKADPDLLLRDLDRADALAFLTEHLTPALDALAAISLKLPFHAIGDAVAGLDAAGSIVLQNRLARRLQRLDWPKVWRKLAPDQTTLGGQGAASAVLSQAYARLADDLASQGRTDAARSLPEPFGGHERTADANLLHAMVLARESSDSREYPVDVAAWERIEAGATAFLPAIAAQLRGADKPSHAYLAHREAKDSGAPRLKCGPCPEDAIQQQYVLSELLRVRSANREMAERIPAVRYWSDQPSLVVTGASRPDAAVSFAYQVDMRALEERPDRSRRRDMFRPFLDCWNSFIRHIGGRIERMRCDLIYVARLDIKSFYDHIPRHAVASVLDRALPDSETLRNFDVAPLLGDPDGDRHQILRAWLLQHSFGDQDRGYRYVDPGSGEATYKPDGGAKGLPQGPALSSYLANIVLFELDTAAEAQVRQLDAEAAADAGARTFGGVYARYVDDIVIAARSPDDLRTLRGLIETRLEALGLELNEKSEHLAPMTADEARNWVVERRGAGFVAYGEVDDQPSPAADLRTSWADIPTLDRRTALSVLHWSALDDPEQTPREDFEALILKVAQAEALRPPDLGHIARRVLLRALLDALEDPREDAVHTFLLHALGLLSPIRTEGAIAKGRVRKEDAAVADALASGREFLAVLTGLERLIVSVPENNPTFSRSVREQIAVARRTLLQWILNAGLLERLWTELVAEDARSQVEQFLGAQLEIQRASLEERAAQALRLGRPIPGFQVVRRPPQDAPGRPGQDIIKVGWLRTFSPDGFANLAVSGVDQLQHAIAAGVQVEGGRLSAPSQLGVGPLSEAIRAIADRELQTVPGSEGSPVEIASTFRALAGVAPSEGEVSPSEALPAFLALSAGPGQSEALARRPALLHGSLPNVTILPVPPLPGQPGVFCYGVQGARRLVHAVFVDQIEAPRDELPPDLDWQEGTPVGPLQRWTAEIPGDRRFLLDPETKIRVIDDDLKTIADVFEGLLQRHAPRGAPKAPLVHVFSLIGPSGHQEEDELGGYFSLSWRTDRADCERLLFERRGDGLAVQRSPHAGAELWRIGQAVADLFAIPHDATAELDDTGVKLDRRLLQARLKRTAFARLRGRWIHAAQVTAALATDSIPHALKRIISALRETSGEDERVGPLALEFLLSGRAMRSRMRIGNAVDVAGGWSRFLELVGSRGLRSGDDDGIFAHAPIRPELSRSARALVRAGDTIEAWAAQAEAGRSQEALAATAAGFELAALRADLRDHVLAMLAGMSDQARERLGRVRPDLSAFEGLGPVFLLEPRFGHGETGGRSEGNPQQEWGYEASWQGRDLFVTLHEALGLRVLQGRAQLDRISTSGWLVVLAVMSGTLDFEMETLVGESETPLRPTFFSLADPSVADSLKSLAFKLLGMAPGVQSTDADLWPWELTEHLDVRALRTAIREARKGLEFVRLAAGLSAVLDPRPLRALAVTDQTVEFYTAEGDHYEVPWWRCTLSATAGERVDRTETVPAGDRRLHPCSLLVDDRGVRLVQVVSESLAKVTGLSSPIDIDPSAAAETKMSISAPDMPEEIAVAPQDGAAATEPAEPPPPQPDPPLEPPNDRPLPPPEEPPVQALPDQPPRSPAARGSFATWRLEQDRLWRRRGENAGLARSGYGRIAILQYDFLNSYEAEVFPTFVVDETTVDPELRVDAGVVDYKLSFAEHRRRQVLAAVLSCCASLGVEALVLPEYSAHPETVSWIARYCQERNYPVSVWAGTFRQLPGFALALVDYRYTPVSLTAPKVVARPMETHISVVFRETQDRAPISFSSTGDIADEAPILRQTLTQGVRHRKKKYPSIGMGEEFMPHSEDLEPLMAQSRSVERVESFINELVCSELFVFNGPLNWSSFADHLVQSAARYRVESDTNWVDVIVKDARLAAEVFSGANGQKPRRSLLFVTCATTRDADYHYFAQSAYLASGIVTAFCNASGPGVTGGSCFVGQGGWETRGGGPAVPNPYHGAAPGILSNGPQRGALGPRENALIVADIRPERTVEDKPRSQALGAPMRLVAHIPIVEDRAFSPVDGRWDATWFRQQRAPWIPAATAAGKVANPDTHAQLLHDAVDTGKISLEAFVGHMLDVLKATETARTTLGLDAAGRDRVIAAGVSLSGLFEHSPGARWRAQMLTQNHHALPEPLPCAALLDWLIVDLDVAGFQKRLTDLRNLAVAKQTAAIPLAELSPALRDAPWRWTERKSADSAS